MYFHQNRLLKTFLCRKNHELIPHPEQCPLGNISMPLRKYIKKVCDDKLSAVVLCSKEAEMFP